MIFDTPSIFVANARTALKIALRQFDMQAGEKIFLPDFICDVLHHPILQSGLIPVYYPVTQSLTPDWHELESLAVNSDCRALVMVHYFGQPQDIERFRVFCSRHDLLLLEDNAHGYGGHVAGKPMGSFGDIGISSPRKILGTPSGGILHGASAMSFEIARDMKSFPVYLPKQILRSVLHSMPKVRRIVKSWADRYKAWSNPRLFRESVQADYGIDWFSRQQIATADWPAIAARRRGSWAAWARYAQSKGLNPVFPEVHPESCPWAMPAYASSLTERNFWLSWCAKSGVSLFPWPALPEDIILLDGDALARWKTLVCFPLDSTPDELGL